jgi:DNA-directed RNA polymerase specialized sigma24 family protein
LALHDVDDVAGFVGAIVSRSGLDLSWSDREDLEQTLQIVAWEISLKFEPGRTVTFSTFAGTILRRRVIDWQRARNGRTVWKFKTHTYIRERPQFVPFDDSARDRLEQSQPEGAGDRTDSGDFGLPGLFEGGDRQPARDLALLGLETDRRAA